MSSASTLVQLRDAVAWALSQGVHVRVGSAGVHCTSTHGSVRWVRDLREDGIDPVGALILRTQPRACDLDAAEAEVLGGSYPLRDGLLDGMAQAPKDRSEWARGNARGLYLYGWEAGVQMRLFCSGRGPVLERTLSAEHV